MFKLIIETDNAAFGETEDDAVIEIKRILLDVAERLGAGILDGTAYDLNGARIGVYSLVKRARKAR
jgi:hypothetical protein